MFVKNSKLFGVLLLIFCIGFFVNTDDVMAIDMCATDTEYSSAISCDYDFYGGSNTIIFAKDNSGNYCPEAVYLEYKTNYLDFHGEADNSIRQMLHYDLNLSTIRDAVENKSCPRLKLVNDYDPVTSKTYSITVSDKDLNQMACDLSEMISLGSECSIREGQNMREISSDDVNNAANKTKNSVPATIEQIKAWGEFAEQNPDNWEVGDSCYIVQSNDWLKGVLNFIFWAMVIAGILLVIILTIFDFIKVITGNDDDGIKQAFKRFVRRVVVAVVLMLLPLLLSTIINFINGNAMSDSEEEGNKTGIVRIGDNGELYCDVVDEQ